MPRQVLGASLGKISSIGIDPGSLQDRFRLVGVDRQQVQINEMTALDEIFGFARQNRGCRVAAMLFAAPQQMDPCRDTDFRCSQDQAARILVLPGEE